jgi:mRNA interferase MazF
MTATRGDVYWCDLRADDDPDQRDWGIRPVIVLSHDYFNRRLDTVVVVALTTNISRARLAGCVLVPRDVVEGSPGLGSDSVALCHTPMSVFQEQLKEPIGVLRDHGVIARIAATLAFVLDLRGEPIS